MSDILSPSQGPAVRMTSKQIPEALTDLQAAVEGALAALDCLERAVKVRPVRRMPFERSANGLPRKNARENRVYGPCSPW